MSIPLLSYPYNDIYNTLVLKAITSQTCISYNRVETQYFLQVVSSFSIFLVLILVSFSFMLQIWSELARIRGGGGGAHDELKVARENLTKILNNVPFCHSTGKSVPLHFAPFICLYLVLWKKPERNYLSMSYLQKYPVQAGCLVCSKLIK